MDALLHVFSEPSYNTMTTSMYIRMTGSSLFYVLFLLSVAVGPLAAQTYSYLPTANITDGRMLSIAGGSIQTLGDNLLTFKIASPASSPSIEIGVFDGDTKGFFDQGTVPLIYALYADPEGDGTGMVKIGEWSGDVMPDNGWYTIILNNTAAARCGTGNFFYALRVRSSNPTAFHWSSFKLRTNGTIAIARASNVAFSAPLGNLTDAGVIYPSYPALTPTTYDGTWRFHMDVPTPVASLEIWDGDFDRGSYDCSDNDTDDPDTPNFLPVWATASAVAEGVAVSNVPCQNAAGESTGGNTTSNPPDDSRSPLFARGTGGSYDVIAPNGVRYANANPSGNLEWEQFRLSTELFDRNTMDYHVDALPSGIYEIAISGMDLGNLNAMRFPFDVAGVGADGNVIPPIRPEYTNGTISGTAYYESGGNCAQGFLELGLPLATVDLEADYNGDGIIDETRSTLTDLLGQFSFTGLRPGTYKVTVDKALLLLNTVPVCDTDGVDTPRVVQGKLTMCSRTLNWAFGFRLLNGLL